MAPHPTISGCAISLSGDTALVGAYLKAGGVGAAYIFVRSGTTWTQQAKLTAIDAACGAIFGIAVSIDGGLAVVGAYKGEWRDLERCTCSPNPVQIGPLSMQSESSQWREGR